MASDTISQSKRSSSVPAFVVREGGVRPLEAVGFGARVGGAQALGHGLSQWGGWGLRCLLCLGCERAVDVRFKSCYGLLESWSSKCVPRTKWNSVTLKLVRNAGSGA